MTSNIKTSTCWTPTPHTDTTHTTPSPDSPLCDVLIVITHEIFKVTPGLVGRWHFNFDGERLDYEIGCEGEKLFLDLLSDGRHAVGELLNDGEWNVVNLKDDSGTEVGRIRLKKVEPAMVKMNFGSPAGDEWSPDFSATKKATKT